jgi:hypothetical protein
VCGMLLKIVVIKKRSMVSIKLSIKE